MSIVKITYLFMPFFNILYTIFAFPIANLRKMVYS